MTEYGFEQRSFQSKSVIFLFVCCLLATLVVWGLALSPDLGGFAGASFNPFLQVDFINVGQGDAILVRTPKGRHYLIDAGTQVSSALARQESRELTHRYLADKRIPRLDGVVVTHPHNDHIGGIAQVLRLFEVDKVWECGSKTDTVSFKDYVDWCEARRIPRVTAKAGDILDWGDELFVQVMHPTEISQSQGFSDLNNMSIAILIRYGKVNMMLTGDIEEESQHEMVPYGKGMACQIIKAPHHGSDTSIFLPFIKLLNPEVAIIQVGKINPFRHPSKAMLELYQRLGIKTYRTDRNGNIRAIIGGKDEKDFRIEVDRVL